MLNELVSDVCSKLEKAKLEYMLSGSVAMGIYTMGRMSWDVDFVISLKEEDIEVFLSLFQKRYFLQPNVIKQEIKREGMFNIIDEQSGFKVDFIIKKSTTFREEEFTRRKKIDFFGKKIYVVALEDLILSKLIWIQQLQSEKQLRDISMLLLNKDLDKNYLLNG